MAGRTKRAWMAAGSVVLVSLLGGCGGSSDDDDEPQVEPNRVLATLAFPSNDVGSVAADDQTLYVGAGIDGVQIVDVSDLEEPKTVGLISAATNSRGFDIVGRVAAADGLLVLDVVPGCSGFCQVVPSVLRVYDVRQPASPRLLAELASDAFDMVLAGRLLYVIRSGDFVFEPDPVTGNFVGTPTAQLEVIDLSTPAQPRTIGTLRTAGVGRLVLQGTLLRIAYSDRNQSSVNDGIESVDIADPTRPRSLGSTGTRPTEPGVGVAAAAEAGALYVADGRASLNIFDTSLATPALTTLVTERPATGVAARPGTLYVAQASSGVAIFDIASPNAPTAVGSITTTTPAGSVHAFAGFGVIVTQEVRSDGDTGSLVSGPEVLLFATP